MHVREHCKLPRWMRRWEHKIYVCSCGKTWTVKWYGTMDGASLRYWQELDLELRARPPER